MHRWFMKRLGRNTVAQNRNSNKPETNYITRSSVKFVASGLRSKIYLIEADLFNGCKVTQGSARI